jgi:hypothetical protein
MRRVFQNQQLGSAFQAARKWLGGVSFIQWHYFYFIATSLVTSLIFWGSSTPAKSVTYIDSLFLCVSAMTEAGLNTVNLSELNTWQQIMMFLLIIFGSAIFVSSSILHIRKRAFEKRFSELVERREQRRRRLRTPRSLTFSLSRRDTAHANDRDPHAAPGAARGRLPDPVVKDDPVSDSLSSTENQRPDEAQNAPPLEPTTTRPGDPGPKEPSPGHIQFAPEVSAEARPQRRNRPLRRSPSFFEGRGVGARGLNNHPRNARPLDVEHSMLDHAIADEPVALATGAKKLHKYIDTVGGYLGRNSQFHHLSDKERRKLGGIEYDAICLLSWLVPTYFVLFQLLGALGVGAWISAIRPNVARINGQVCEPVPETLQLMFALVSILSGPGSSSPSVPSTTVAWLFSTPMPLH